MFADESMGDLTTSSAALSLQSWVNSRRWFTCECPSVLCHGLKEVGGGRTSREIAFGGGGRVMVNTPETL
jgi:hypothetical protein